MPRKRAFPLTLITSRSRRASRGFRGDALFLSQIDNRIAEHGPRPVIWTPAAKQQIIDEGSTGRVCEHRTNRRGVAAQGHKESGEEDRRGDDQRAARRRGVRARQSRALREEGGLGGLPQRPVCQKARHWSREGRNKCVRMLGALGEVFTGARHRHCAVISTATCWKGFP